MSAAIVPFRRAASKATKRPAPPDRPIAPTGGEVGVYRTEADTFAVYDISASGGSAGHHGCFDSRAEAAAVAKQIAAKIGGTFIDKTDGGITE